MENKKRILVSPLDWGLGHATRCIPLIRELLEQDAEVMIAADKRPLTLLQQEFPQLECISLPGYDISYPAKGSMALSMFLQSPGILSAIKREHRELDRLIDTHKIHGVISDNRYGLWTSRIPSVFITHQVTVKCPPALGWLEPFTYHATRSFMRKYYACWVPDMPGESNLSGDLSHKYPVPANTSYIGPLSRFRGGQTLEHKQYELMAIVSGPEPQRTLFEEMLIPQLKTMPGRSLALRGVPGPRLEKDFGNVRVISHLPSGEMEQAILSSELIISRPGYSTVMDLLTLGSNAIFIPTPGQTEQEYLARHFMEKKLFFSTSQKNLDLRHCLERAGEYKSIALEKSTGVLAAAVKTFLQHVQVN